MEVGSYAFNSGGVSSTTNPINMPALLTFQMGTLKNHRCGILIQTLRDEAKCWALEIQRSVSMGASPMKHPTFCWCIWTFDPFPHGRCDQREGDAVTISILVESPIRWIKSWHLCVSENSDSHEMAMVYFFLPPVGNQPLPGFSTISIGRQWSKERNVQRYLKNFKDLLNYGNEEASQIMMSVCICVSFIPVSDASRPVYDCWVVLQMCIQATWIGKWFHPTNLGQTIPGVTNNISASDAFHGFDLERANTHIHPLICASRGLWNLFSLK